MVDVGQLSCHSKGTKRLKRSRGSDVGKRENWELQPGVNHLLRMRVHVAHQTIGSEPGHFKLLVSNERSQYASTVCLGTSVYIDAAYCKD